MKRWIKQIGGSWLFLLIMIFIYLLIWLFSSKLFFSSLNTFKMIFLKMIPILIVVFVFIFLINLFFKTEKVKKYLGAESGIKGLLFVIIGGIVSVGSIYLWYPLLAELHEKGMCYKLIAVFLYNRAVKIPLLPMLIFYFGVKFTIILTIVMILFSLLVGLAVEKMLSFDIRGSIDRG